MTEPCKDAFSKAKSLGFNSLRILEGGKHKEASEMQHGNRPSRPKPLPDQATATMQVGMAFNT